MLFGFIASIMVAALSLYDLSAVFYIELHFSTSTYFRYLSFAQSHSGLIFMMQGDSISCELTVKDGCTAILTTQSSTKVINLPRLALIR